MADQKLNAKLGLDNSEFKRELAESQKQLSGLSTGFNKLGAVMGVVFSTQQIVAFSKESMKLAASAEGVRAGFEHIAKPGFLNELRTATRGAVGDFQLMQTAIQASNFQIPLEQLASLLKFASARAIQTGQSVDYLVQSIILGIGRKSPLILDNLGISAVRLKEVLKGAGVEMSTVGDVAAAVGKIATEELNRMGDVADTTSTKMAQLEVASQRLKEAWGNWLNKSKPVNAMREYFTTILNFWADESKNFGEKFMMLMPFYGGNFLKPKGYTNLNPLAPGTESLGGPLEGIIKAEIKRTNTIASLNEQLEKEKKLLEQIDIADTNAMRTQQQVIADLEKRIKNLTTLKEVNPLVAKLPIAKGFTEENTDRYSEIIKQWYDFQKVRNNLAKTNNKGAKESTDEMTEALQLQGEAINILTNSFDALFSSAGDGFKNMVDTIIQGLQRLVAEYLAKAAIFGLIRLLFPGSDLATMATENLWNMGIGGKASGNLGGFQSQPLNVNVVGSIKGKDIALAMRRNV